MSNIDGCERFVCIDYSSRTWTKKTKKKKDCIFATVLKTYPFFFVFYKNSLSVIFCPFWLISICCCCCCSAHNHLIVIRWIDAIFLVEFLGDQRSIKATTMIEHRLKNAHYPMPRWRNMTIICGAVCRLNLMGPRCVYTHTTLVRYEYNELHFWNKFFCPFAHESNVHATNYNDIVLGQI